MRVAGACVCCGGTDFVTPGGIIWDDLARQWGLDEDERATIERQQGERCERCGVALRSRVLAFAILTALGYQGLFQDFVRRYRGSVLEVNEAGQLTGLLSRLRRRTLAQYPAVDMQNLPYPDATFDLVVHSDTLEHVPDPVQALRECRRVLKHGGALAYTVPAVPGRRSRRRDGLEPSHHGGEGDGFADYLVYTEYGDDAWTQLFEAGFEDVRLTSNAYPASVALVAIRA